MYITGSCPHPRQLTTVATSHFRRRRQTAILLIWSRSFRWGIGFKFFYLENFHGYCKPPLGEDWRSSILKSLSINVYGFFRFPQQQIVKAPITPLAQESTLPCPYLRWVLPMAYFLPILEVSLFTMWWHWWSRKDYPKPEINKRRRRK